MAKCEIGYRSQNIDSLFHLIQIVKMLEFGHVPNFWPSNKISLGMLEKKREMKQLSANTFLTVPKDL